jgi:hypothetical protein
MAMASPQLPAGSPPAYAKQEYVGAVTLLHFSSDGSLLFVGVGASLYAYATATGRLATSYQVFSRGTLHGLDYGITVLVLPFIIPTIPLQAVLTQLLVNV